MNNLIIHPEDNSTTFLKTIYEKAENQSLIEKNTDPNQIANAIKRSDRTIMLGHGSPSGLFSIKLFNNNKRQIDRWKWLAIGKDESELLKKSKKSNQNIYIWCNADKFVEFYNLKGFYSGMFISEVCEAGFCGVGIVTQEVVNESNFTFSEIVGKYINLFISELYEKVMKEYGELAQTNLVAKFNHQRLHLR